MRLTPYGQRPKRAKYVGSLAIGGAGDVVDDDVPRAANAELCE
jgi:hypothetical protein